MKSIWLPETKHLFRYRTHLIIWYKLSYFWSRKQITRRGRCFSYSDSGGQLSSVFGSLLMHIFQPNSLYSIVLDVKSDSLTFWQQLGISTNISLNSESRRCKQSRSYFHVRSLEVCEARRVGFPVSSVSQESTCNAGDPSTIPRSGTSAGEGIDYPLQCSWALLVAQMVKNPSAMRETGVNPWVGKIPWRREQLLTLVFWPGEFHELYGPWGCRVRHDWETFTSLD